MKRTKISSLATEAFLLAIMTIVISSCSSSTNATTPPNTVTMSGAQFHPKTLTITKGTEVTWLNDDGVTHTSTSDKGIWDTKDIEAGKSKKIPFNTVGTFTYVCIYHSNMGMVGTIIVQ